MPPIAPGATPALVVGIPGRGAPFAALARVFFSPPEPGSMIPWPLLPLPLGEGRVRESYSFDEDPPHPNPLPRGEGTEYVKRRHGRDHPGDGCHRFYWSQRRTCL